MKVLIVSLLLLNFAIAHAADPILNWIQKDNHYSSDIEKVWNPGVLPFEETQIRVDIDEDGKASEYSVRYSLKPLMGLKNEFKLSRQRRKILELEKISLEQTLTIEAYKDILLYWKIQSAYKVLSESESLYRSAQNLIKNIHSNQSLDFDITSYLTNLASFNSSKTEIESKKEQIKKIFSEKTEKTQEILTQAENMKFLSLIQLKNYILSLSTHDLTSQVENEKKQLKYYEFEKRKKESSQLLKFISFSQDSRPVNSSDYRFQLAIKVPFLSDSQELERAKIDYLQSNLKLEQDKVKNRRDALLLVSELKGLIEKATILSHLPEKSHNKKKLSNTLFSLSEAVKSENQFIQAKFDFIETQALIFEKYLLLLGLNNQLKSKSVNYLTDLP